MTTFGRCGWFRTVLAVAGLLAAGAGFVQARTIYVSTAGNDANDGLTWGTARLTVQAGLNAAVSTDQVWVAAGTYLENITLKSGVALYGGFAGEETDLGQRDWLANLTILDGNKAGTVVTVPVGAAAGTRIDGFTIRNGQGNGVYCTNASAAIANNTITGNSGGSFGAGICCTSSTVSIVNNVITANRCGGGGGGIYCASSTATISGNTISGNTAVDGAGIDCSGTGCTVTGNTITGNIANTGGGGIYGPGGGTITNNIISGNRSGERGGGIYQTFVGTIANNVITGNTAWSGGGIYAIGSGAISNNVIAGNGAGIGGGLSFWHCSPTLVNNTIVSNGASEGGAMYCEASSPTLVNTILAFNSSGTRSIGEGTPVLRYTCVYGNKAYSFSGMADPTGTNGNIAVDPKLAAHAYGNLHIQPDSPCVGAGDDTAIQAGWTDMDAQPRKQGPRVDIGADESDGTTWPAGPYIVVRVKPDGDDANDGSSWPLAKRTVQAAIDAAAAIGGEVWVAAGTYNERIQLRDLACVYGGFAVGENNRSERDWNANATVLDGQQGGPVVTAVNLGYALATLDGFTVRNGRADYAAPGRNGGGILCQDASPAIANNTISGNYATDDGAGLFCDTGAPLITGNTIRGNTCGGDGGGVCGDQSAPWIEGNTISSNKASSGGGGASLEMGTLVGNTLSGNEAASGGGVYSFYMEPVTVRNNRIVANRATGTPNWGDGGGICTSGQMTIEGNVITGNGANRGGGVCCKSYPNSLVNNTISGNNAASGGGVFCDGSLSMLVNNIVAFNSSGICTVVGVPPKPGTPEVRYCCVYGNADYDYSGMMDPTGTAGNISADPVFAGAAYGNLHIQPGSPCVNAGDDAAVQAGATDMDGQPRKQGSHVDIGADESDGTTWPAGPNAVVRVRPDGNDANDGSSWALAKRTVQAAIDAAAAAGGEVWVAAGTYAEQINLRDLAHVYGGFAGTESAPTDRDWAKNVTVLDGGQGGSVVTIDAAAYGMATIDGFVIRNGSGTVSSYDRYGGGIYCKSSRPTISHNTITGNNASYGGGIHCQSAAIITDNVITNNNATYGAAMYISTMGPSCTAARNLIRGNKAYTGGGIYCSGGSPSLVSNVILGNNASSGAGGIYLSSAAAAVIVNNTIAGNQAYVGGAVYSYSKSSARIVNSIIAFNSSGYYSEGANTVLANNCVYGNSDYNYNGLTDPTGSAGNISADPLFAGSVYGDLHIQPGSPCIDAGDDAAIQASWTDMDGQPRRQGVRVDIGADESDGTTWPGGPNVVIRVASGGDDANDGSSWPLAKRTVQAAIDAAAAVGGDVWVAAGTYGERVNLADFVHLYGGFAGSETDRSARDWSANPAILDGQQAGRVITVPGTGHGLTTIDGFTVRNGKASGSEPDSFGGGIYCTAAPTIRNNVITGNSAATGGGIYVRYFANVTNNVVAGNVADYGAGIYSWSTVLIANNRIAGNAALMSGGGIDTKGTAATIVNNTITGNTARTYGGGIYAEANLTTVTNNTFIGNSAKEGGAIYGYYPVAVANTIAAFNTSGIYWSSSSTFRNNCVYGNAAYNYPTWGDQTGTNGNIAVDPRLAGAAYGNLHIQPDSPCVDAGDDTAIQAGWTDLDGQPRRQGVRVDIGADESDGTTWPGGPNVVVRVAPTGDDANDGSSWPLAKRTVQAAIDAAAAVGGDVWVAAGTYVERITLRDMAHVYGGFAGTETQRLRRDWLHNVAILDGGQAGSVVTASQLGYGLSTVDGFTIRNGNGTMVEYARRGGGIFCQDASPTIANNSITANPAYAHGGGIYCYASYSTITGNSITGNSGSSGGAIFCDYASPLIDRNLVARNRAGNGAGIYCSNSRPTIANNTIVGNTGSYGGAIYCTSSASARIVNNTLAGNSATYGGGIYTSLSSPTIINTIIAWNTSGIAVSGTSIPFVRYSCVYGNAAYNYSNMSDPTGVDGNLSVDPKLAAVAYGNLHIQPGSPCVDAGDDAAIQASWTDMDGQPRKQGARVDIGADESDGTTWPGGPNVVVRVAPAGDDANDGSSWPLAKRTVQAAIDAAAAAGGDVWVAAGTYVERITLRDMAHVYGGFAATETSRGERDWTRNITILDGGQGGSVVTASQLAYGLSTIDGFTIRNGTGTLRNVSNCYGGGIHCSYASPTIANNVITGNSAVSASGYGGGVYLAYSCATLSRNTITLNSAATAGAGIYCASSSAAVVSNTIAGNTASVAGGGIYCSSGGPRIIGNAITGNAAAKGGGVYCSSCPAWIACNTIAGNSASADGGALYCSSSAPIVADTIIAFNSSGIYRYGTYTPTLRNACVYGNTAYNFSNMADPTGANGNISANPLFVRLAGPGEDGSWGTPDDDGGDWRLLPGSPCIDAGSNAGVQADTTDLDGDGDTAELLPIDLAGAPRLTDDPYVVDTGSGAPPIVDIGAYEHRCGDVTGDGLVDVVDLLRLVDAFGTYQGDAAYDPACDFNADGAVDVLDLLDIVYSFGT